MAAVAGYGHQRREMGDLPGGSPIPLPGPGVREGDARGAGQRAEQQARAPHPGAVLEAVDLALGSRAVSGWVSRMTLIRLIRAMPEPAVNQAPRVRGWMSSPCARGTAAGR
jgi:hypothetical protein